MKCRKVSPISSAARSGKAKEAQMAHQLVQVGERTAFAYNKANGDPWHRLGTAMDGLQTPDDMLAAAFANYLVDIAPTYARIPVSGPAANTVEIDGEYFKFVEMPDTKATWRFDEMNNTEQVLGTVGNRYTVHQNYELLDRALTIVGAAEGSAVVDTCGVMYEGRQFFALLDLGDLVIDPIGINDVINRYLVVATSHDGSRAITYCNTNVRVVCNNTLRMALGRNANSVTAKHTPNAEAKLNEAQRLLGMSTAWADAFAAKAEDLLRVTVTEGTIDKVVTKLFPITSDGDRAKRNQDELMVTMRGIFANDKNAQKVGPNGFALYNAVGEYLDHKRGGKDMDRLMVTAEEASWVSVRKMQAADLILAL